jgi:hypothetical protein
MCLSLNGKIFSHPKVRGISILQHLLTVLTCMWFIKVQFTLEQAMKAQRGSSYSHTLFSTSALDGGGWLMQRPGHFTSGKEIQCPSRRGLSGPQGSSGWLQKILPQPRFDHGPASL